MSAPEPPSSPYSNRWRWGLFLTLLLALLIIARFLPLQTILQDTLRSVARLGGWAGIAFIAIYTVATVFLIPGSILTLGAGAVFGLAWGCVYASMASTSGAICAFLIGRHWARESLTQRFQNNPKFAAVDQAVAREGWKIVGLTRLSPLFPFTVLNYAFGLTQVSLRDYAIASWIGMMPGTILYVYLGSLATAATSNQPRSTGEWIYSGVGLVATALATLLITRLARRALAERVQSSPQDPQRS